VLNIIKINFSTKAYRKFHFHLEVKLALKTASFQVLTPPLVSNTHVTH